VLSCIGATLDYVSRSTEITTTYPQLEIKPGESGAGFLLRLLALVPDVLYFNGLDGYMVHSQDDDGPAARSISRLRRLRHRTAPLPL